MNKQLILGILGFVSLIVVISGCVDHSPLKSENFASYYTFSESNNGEQFFVGYNENTTQIIIDYSNMKMLNGAHEGSIYIQTLNIPADKANYIKNFNSNVIENISVPMKIVPSNGRLIIKTNNTKGLVITNKYCQGNLELIFPNNY